VDVGGISNNCKNHPSLFLADHWPSVRALRLSGLHQVPGQGVRPQGIPRGGARRRSLRQSQIGIIERWKQRARTLKTEVHGLYLAYRDPRVPWYARVWLACVLAYAFSPIDLIPDPIPILGYLDDLVLIPLGVALALRMIPRGIMEEARVRAKAAASEGKPTNWVAAALIVGIWLVLTIIAVRLAVRVVSD